MQQDRTDLSPLPDAAQARSLTEDLRLLADEAKALAQAEFAYQKSRAAYAGAETRNIVLLLATAVVLVFFAVMALVIGSVIALGPVLGRWGAMAAVTLVLLAIATAGMLMARARVRRMKSVLAEDGER